MSELITRIEIPKPSFSLDYNSSILMMGSCFTDNIGKRLDQLKFKVLHNPFGVVYNPISLSHQIDLIVNKESFTEADLDYYNELWFSYSHYTLFSDTDKTKCLQKINSGFKNGKKFLGSADVIFLTLGTSFVYKLKDTGRVVANCHKIPAKNFTRYFSSVENTVKVLRNAINLTRSKNRNVHFVFTVSPIRHWKDGAVENQRSKAALLLAIAQLLNELDNIYYFPVYEFFMDELRDYRYYADDMLHPSQLAMELVWNRFSDTFLTDESLAIAEQIGNIITALKHRPRNRTTKAYAKFLANLEKKIKLLVQSYPFLDFSDEKKNLSNLFNKN